MHVLLIEDNEDDAALIRDVLSRQGGEPVIVEWADRLDTGLAQLAHGPFDAILADLSLPDNHGLDIVSTLRRHRRDAPVIVLTGLDDAAVAEQALRHGAQDYWVKSRLSPDGLTRAIRYAIERHQTELALRRSEERFHLACRAARDAIWDWDIDVDTLIWNDTYRSVFGHSLPEKDNRMATWSERIHPEERAGVLAGLHATIQSSDTIWTAEFRFLRTDGTYAYALNRGYVVRSDDGVPRRMIGAMIDMSERRQSDRQRAAQLAVTIALDESVSLGEAMPALLRVIGELKDWVFGSLWLVDTHKKVLRVDATWHSPSINADALTAAYRTACLRLGVGLAGQTWKAAIPLILADVSEDTTFLTASMTQQAGLRGACAFPIHRGEDIMGVLEFYTQDVLRADDEQRQMLADLGAKISQLLHRKDLERQLRQSQKMEALGTMASGIAHDFNNLLTVINSWSALVLEHVSVDEKWKRGLTHIKEAGDKAAGLTRQLLAFTRQQVVEQQVVSLNERVMNIVELMQRVIGEDIHLAVNLDSHLWQVKGDAGQIEQVIMNLVVNARDAMPQGGRLELTTANVRVEETDSAGQEELRPGSYAVLTVRDSGCGMDEETLAHIFEPFFTTKERGKGTGLGLSTVYGIIKQSDGSITVKSELDVGTTFTIYFPQLVARPPDPPPEPVASPLLRGSETVLLVEDDEMVLVLAQVVLEAQRYRVLPARNAEQAIELVRHHAQEIDVVLTDTVMPGMGGPALAERLLQLRPGLRVIVTSGYAGRGQEFIQSLGSQAAFLQKPYTPDMLTKKLREVLGSSGAPRPMQD